MSLEEGSSNKDNASDASEISNILSNMRAVVYEAAQTRSRALRLFQAAEAAAFDNAMWRTMPDILSDNVHNQLIFGCHYIIRHGWSGPAYLARLGTDGFESNEYDKNPVSLKDPKLRIWI